MIRHYADRRRGDLIFDHRHNAEKRKLDSCVGM